MCPRCKGNGERGGDPCICCAGTGTLTAASEHQINTDLSTQTKENEE